MITLQDGWKAIGRQLRHPSGFPGRLLGRAMAVINREPNRIAIDALHAQPHDVVLELGFGSGRAIAQLAVLAHSGLVLGIDHSETMIIQARRFNADKIKHSRIDLRQGRLDELPWGTNTVNKILAVNVLYFVSKSGSEIREMRRVLGNGGRIVIYATDRSSMKNWKMCTPDTHQMYDQEDMVRVLQRGGFTDDEIEVSQVACGVGIVGLLAIVRKLTGHI